MDAECIIHLTPDMIRRGAWRLWKYKYVRVKEIVLIFLFLACLIVFGVVQRDWLASWIIGGLTLAFWVPRISAYLTIRKSLGRGAEAGITYSLRISDAFCALGKDGTISEYSWLDIRESVRSEDLLFLLWDRRPGVTLIPLSQIDNNLAEFILKRTSAPPRIQKD